MRTLLPLSVIGLAACGSPDCLTGRDDCRVAPACPELTFTCDGGFAEVYVLAAGDPVPVTGPDALAAVGDVVLANEGVVAVLDALDHPHYVSPAGGTLLDLERRDQADDGLRNLQQAIGVLPGEAFHYTEFEIVEEGDVKAVQFRGTLDGYPDTNVATRYEIRPCDPGVRIRTELTHLGDDPLSLWLIDGFYWGGREHVPFTPVAGFDHPEFGLTTLQTAFRQVPWMAGAVHGHAASYGITACDDEAPIEGFQSSEISAIGQSPRVLQPRGWATYDRFVAVGEGPAVSTVSDVLMDVRSRLFGEKFRVVEGRLSTTDTLGPQVRASVILEGKDGPVTHAVPDAEGRFSARVPSAETITLRVEAFGAEVASESIAAGADDVDVGDLTIPAAATLTLDVTVDGVADHALVFVHPADDATRERVETTMLGHTEVCAPLLGIPFGASPACNRVLVDGPVTVSVPDGNYDVYAVAGPFTTMASVGSVTASAGTGQSVLLELVTLPLQPLGTLSADFHVHGRVSFDSGLPDHDRVRSFLASRVDVVVSTDHDVVNDYAAAMEALDARDRMQLIVGLETTGHILYPLLEETYLPKVIGHFNFWPMPYDPTSAWRGAPWDELAQPGELFTRARDLGWPEPTGVIQLNHPWGGAQFGRDFAWPTAIGLDLTLPLPRRDDGTGQFLFRATPKGADFANDAYHVQEVMNGTNNAAYQQYRAIWHYLLDQGILRGGTANSDSHTLTDNVIGTPRTLVWADTSLASFDEVVFDRAVREGRMSGTNGPVIEASTADIDGAIRPPSILPFVPDEDGVLFVRVAAAPWVPVDEVRIRVNGEVVVTFDDLPVPADPYGVGELQRLDTAVAMSELLAGVDGDAWITIEAGVAEVENADLNCDGVPDTGDNDGNGVIDWRDVEEEVEDPDLACLDTVGPLAEPAAPEEGSRDFLYRQVTPGGHPTAFTNPFVLDRDGGGYGGVP